MSHDDQPLATGGVMQRKEHEERSMAAFGKPFSEVHVFMDRFFPRYKDLTHRLVLHHRLGIELVGVLMGSDAYLAARQHVLDDMHRLFPGPEEIMIMPAFAPGSFDIGRLAEDMSSALGYVPDFRAQYALKNKRLKCACGYAGAMRQRAEPASSPGATPRALSQQSEYTCPWCGGEVRKGQQSPAPVWPAAPGKFDILRELAVGARFRRGLPEEMRRIVQEN